MIKYLLTFNRHLHHLETCLLHLRPNILAQKIVLSFILSVLIEGNSEDALLYIPLRNIQNR